jgi:hypothetical protein
MNDFNQSEQLHFEFEEYTTMPNVEQLIAQRSPTVIKDGAFDPHQLMMKKKLTDAGAIDTTPTQSWPEKDIKALEDFCKKYGLVGFNCGRMSPIAALSMLKQKLGVIEPTENRETYSDAMNKKMLLKG